MAALAPTYGFRASGSMLANSACCCGELAQLRRRIFVKSPAEGGDWIENWQSMRFCWGGFQAN